MNPESNTDYVCLHCGGTVDIENERYVCNSCQHYYIQINTFPILVADEIQYLNEIYASIQVHKHRTHNYLGSNRALFYLQPKREHYFNMLCEAYECNMELYDQLAKDIFPHINPELLAASDFTTYYNEPLKGKEMNYLIRDWGGLEESEVEIENILATLHRLIKDFSANNDSIFFVGSGTGRFAYEATPDFKKVYCSDLSYRMINMFHYVLQERDLKVYEINGFSNIYHPGDAVRPVAVKIRNKKSEHNQQKLHYFISDIKKIPLRDNSLDIISSIYFIDVIPIEAYIQELKRVLKDGGLYINIGPVGYSGNTFVHHLVPEEIKNVFLEHDFEILHEEFLENTYMKSNLTSSTVIHHNWVFVARNKTGKGNAQLLSEHSILNIDQHVFTEKKAMLSSEGEIVIDNQFYNVKGDLYKDADLIIEFLYLIDGKRTILEIIHAIEDKFDINIAVDEILPVLKELIANRILKILRI